MTLLPRERGRPQNFRKVANLSGNSCEDEGPRDATSFMENHGSSLFIRNVGYEDEDQSE